jgi:tetratricopeptide (TPR) repeat protein
MGKSNDTNSEQATVNWLPRLGAISWLVVALLASLGWLLGDWFSTVPEDVTIRYVGRNKCTACHQGQVEQWTGSHHDKAMDEAVEGTVLGNFNDAELVHHGIESRMYRRDGKYMVHTEGPDGKMADFQVKYVFGVDPLQQYMVEFDRPAKLPNDGHHVGRLQVLRISWDTRAKKWFYLNPPDVQEKLEPTDDLHWTGIAQCWNTMCADCHSTNLKKNFDAESGKYHTSFDEIDVSCESCHGPGSLHIQLAESKSLFWDRHHGYGLARLKGKDSTAEIQTCAPCHSRRSIVHPDFRPGKGLYNYYANELLRPETYHADGQIMDEVYVYGSFVQSKMFSKGIRCSDCHNPHTTKIKFTDNRLCTSCHQHPVAKYDTAAHHQHKTGSTGSSCVECHMPATTYMEVDPRRDHSLRVPRPDLSVSLQTPNACTGCHLERTALPKEKQQALKLEEYADWLRIAREGNASVAGELQKIDQWAAQAVEQWFPNSKSRGPHFAAALKAARDRSATADEQLQRVVKNRKYPSIARASALMWLDPFQSTGNAQTLFRNLKDADPQVRRAALAALQGFTGTGGGPPYEDLVLQATKLLRDPVRSVRTAAAEVLAPVPRQMFSLKQQKELKAAVGELEQGILANNDRAAAYVTLGLLYENLNRREDAIKAYRQGIQVEPSATGPRANLSELLQQELDARMQQIATAQRINDVARVQQLMRGTEEKYHEIEQLRKQELVNFARDAGYAPDNPMVQYRYGLALYRDGQLDQAEERLVRAHELDDQNTTFLIAIARLLQSRQKIDEAIKYAQTLVELDPRHGQFLLELQQQRNGPVPPNPR